MRYEVIKQLKGGTTCHTYLVRLLDNGMYSFLKELSWDGEDWEFYSMEGMILKKEIHKGIPRLYFLEEAEGKLRLFQEFIDGKSFAELLNEAKEPMSVIFCIRELCQILQSLHHAGFVYLDLKPEHIICGKDGIHLVDFGNCRRIGTPVGRKLTEFYAAPGQYDGAAADVHMDIYSIGVLLMEVLQQSGKKERNIQWERWISGIIEGCMGQDRKLLYRNMEDLIVALENKSRSDIRISVYGTREHAGCTHLALSFGSYLGRMGRYAAYIGKEATYQHLLENGVLKENGVFFKNLKLDGATTDIDRIYQYQGVLVPEPDWSYLHGWESVPIRIYDYGAADNWQRQISFQKKGEVGIVVISGLAPWDDKRRMIRELQKIEQNCRAPLIFVTNLVNKKDNKELKKYLEMDVLHMPYIDICAGDTLESLRFMKRLDKRILQQL